MKEDNGLSADFLQKAKQWEVDGVFDEIAAKIDKQLQTPITRGRTKSANEELAVWEKCVEKQSVFPERIILSVLHAVAP